MPTEPWLICHHPKVDFADAAMARIGVTSLATPERCGACGWYDLKADRNVC